MKLLIAYNFDAEEFHVEAPNFYKSCADKVFPKFGVMTEFLPDIRKQKIYKILISTGINSNLALNLITLCWLLKNGHKFDIILGWQANGIIVALAKYIFNWKSTKTCVIFYQLPFIKKNRFNAYYKKFILNATSKGSDLMMSLDKKQTKYFERILDRKKGTTETLRYGIDDEWYLKYSNLNQSNSKKNIIFCPGSANRNDSILEKAVEYKNVVIKKFQLDKGNVYSKKIEYKGNVIIENIKNEKYEKYLKECIDADIVVIPVNSKDTPVGLTSLLECMAIGKPVIITKGMSSEDYLVDGVTGIQYEINNCIDLREKINYLLENQDLAEAIGINAREYVRKFYGVENCGSIFYKQLNKILRI